MDSRSPWSRSDTVAGFAQSPPNQTLMIFARAELRRLGGRGLALDIGCGAGRNALPLTLDGWDLLGIDLSLPMLVSANERRRQEPLRRRLDLALASMEAIPARGGCADFVIAHGIWNLARSARAFRRGVAEAARVSKPGAALFLFTFSRNTLPRQARPIAGESFVFTDFSGDPQCFLTEEQLISELGAHGFRPDAGVPLREHNLPKAGVLQAARLPVIYEVTFRYRA